MLLKSSFHHDTLRLSPSAEFNLQAQAGHKWTWGLMRLVMCVLQLFEGKVCCLLGQAVDLLLLDFIFPIKRKQFMVKQVLLTKPTFSFG